MGAFEEVELKFEISDCATKVPSILEGMFGTPTRLTQLSVYFDTPEQDIAAVGLSLRVRRKDRKFVQTVKSCKASTGLFVRSEWEFPVSGFEAVLDDRTPIRSQLGSKADRVEPLFSVENKRLVWQVADIEIALDRGKVCAGGREHPFFEMELEARDCPVRTLFELARRIGKAVPFHLGVLSKRDRGYRLLGPLPKASHARALRLQGNMAVAEASQVIGLSCLQHFRLNAPLVEERLDADALHQSRVALRRLRSAFSLFKPVLDAPRVARLRQEIGWLAGELARAREIDVLLERVSQEPLRQRLREMRGEAYLQATQAIQSERGRDAVFDVAEWLMVGKQREGEQDKVPTAPLAFDLARAVLERHHRKVRRKGRGLAELDDAQRHALRKCAKTLRYAADFFEGLFPGKKARHRHARFIHALESLQDILGELNDLSSAPDLLCQFGSEHMSIMDYDGARKADLLLAAQKAHNAFVAARPFWN